MKEDIHLWRLALKASPDSFGLMPAGFSPSVAQSNSPSLAPSNSPGNSQGSNGFSDSNSLEDILPPDWKKYNYTIGNFDSVLLSAYERLKQLFPGVYVNVLNGKRVNNWGGLRSPACTEGAPQSAHKTGKALDLHHRSKLNELRDYCESAEGFKLGIKRVEHRKHTGSWVHIDLFSPNMNNWKDKTKPYIFTVNNKT
jgi:uncharacterized protein YcbK (DUF882 family)